MAYGKISETFWHDEKIRALTESARYFMLYLMSCPHGNRIGLFVLDPLYAAADISWTPDRVSAALAELEQAGRIGWSSRARVVFVRNFLKHNTLVNGNVVKGALNDLRSLPDNPLLGDLLAVVQGAQIGPDGPTLVHYRDLEAEIQRRCDHLTPRLPKNGVLTTETNNTENDSCNDSSTNGLGTGSNRPTPLRPNLTRPDLTPPAPSAAPGDLPPSGGGEQEGEGVEKKVSKHAPIHPGTAALWDPEVEAAVLGLWHYGDEWIEVYDDRIGLGLERNLASDLLHETDDPEFVRWLIVEGGILLGWHTEPRSLAYAKLPQMLAQARAKFEASHEPMTADVDLERLKMPKPGDGRARAM